MFSNGKKENTNLGVKKNEVNGLVPFMICGSTTLRLFAGAEAVWCLKPTVE